MNTTPLQALYNTDFNSWIQQHIFLLKAGRVNEIDNTHLIEELEDMARKNKDELVNRLVILIAHLLKWQYQPNYQSNSWRSTIDEQRDQINANIENYPSLKPYIPEAIEKSYQRAVKLAIKETKLPATSFPENCSYTKEQLLDEDFYPSIEK
jgi:hypothetical protein